MEIALHQPVSFFDRIVQSAGKLTETASTEVASRSSRTKTKEIHDAVSLPSHIESTVIDFQKSMLDYLRRNNVKLSQNEASVKEQIPMIMKLLLEMDKDPTMKKQIGIFEQNIRNFAIKSNMSPDGLVTAIRNIKAPELLILPIIGEILLGAGLGAAGAVIKHIVFPPAPPPPPPSPNK